MTRAWTRSCAACSVRKGLIFLMLWSANLQDRAVFAMCSLKVSWSSKITPRFLTEADGVIVDEPNWIVKSCCRVGVAGKTRSSVFARLSCRWCSFIHAEMSARQPEIRAATVGSSGRNERCIYVAPWSCEARHLIPLYVHTCSGMTIKLNLTWLD